MPRQDFKPPKLNRLILAVANAIVPMALKARSVVGVRFRDEDLEKLKKLKSERLVILPNHPTNTEPVILFNLGHKVGQAFNYVACREGFDHFGGLWGWLIQRLGAYSLVRGALDRPSFTMTKQLLAKPGAKLVIFPEGEVYSQNDSLLPFQSGVIQLAFWGLEEALEKDPKADVKLLPIAVRYTFTQDMTTEISESIERLERAVGLPIGKGEDAYTRVRKVGELVVTKLEAQFELKPPKGSNLGERMDVVKRTQLERAAEIAKVKIKGGPLAEEMRMVINAVHRVTNDPSAAKTDYDRKLWTEARNHIQPALHELDRLANWIAVYDGYVAASPTAERMVHLLVRMEKEVLGLVAIRGRQIAHVGIGNPISLSERLTDYEVDKRGTVASITKESEANVQDILTSLV
ncbi:MAG: lysophospholipid acyltransferase family protein [Chlorobia bacterium]|nr:lysophospholipid acyltransferase family protein [Fimbriimonadaceae bacterium]